MKKVIGLLVLLVFSSTAMAESHTSASVRIFAGSTNLTVERLSQEEMASTEGNFGPLAGVGVGAAIGAATGGIAAYQNGAGVGRIIAASALGAISGASLGLATSSLALGAVMRTYYSIRSVGAGVGSDMVGRGG